MDYYFIRISYYSRLLSDFSFPTETKNTNVDESSQDNELNDLKIMDSSHDCLF